MQTLSQLMEQSEAQYRIFDLGRSVRTLDHSTFKKFEASEIPYPYPMLGHAWFALLFWAPETKQEHQIWFIKFPLDEQGLLKQACRDDFIKRTLEEIAQQQAGEQRQKAAADNPWGFTPKQDKMATIHAKCSVAMGMEPSQFYGGARAYLQQPKGDWQTLGLQGIADFCARLEQDDNEAILIQALPALPDEFLLLFLPQLENEILSPALAEATSTRCQNFSNGNLVSATIRALAQAKGDALQHYVTQSLASPQRHNVEVLVAISGRAWEVLSNDAIALQFLEALAANDAGQQAFNHILRDLLYLPEIGPLIRQTFRSQARSERLIETLGEFLKDVQ